MELEGEHLQKEASQSREKVAELSTKLEGARAEVTQLTQLLELAAGLGERGTELLFELKASRVEVVRLQLVSLQAMVLSKDNHSDVYRHKVEFEQSHYARDGFTKGLPEVSLLYLGLDLSTSYKSS
ncbi:hypothetical protein ACLOJK_003985 [Asimina triloba]